MSLIDPQLAAEYRRQGWWSDDTVSAAVARNAVRWPERPAWTSEGASLSWARFDAEATALARVLAGAGVGTGDRVAVCMPDGIEIHVAFVAIERLGATIVGLGGKAGVREIAHLLGRSDCRVLLTLPRYDARPAAELVADLAARGIAPQHLVVEVQDGRTAIRAAGPAAPAERLPDIVPDPDALYLINSTSGTTGLPKAVLHTQNRWHYFHTRAVANGELREGEVMLSIVPAPFGFGLWTSHVTPAKLGAHTVVMPRFSALAAARAIQEHRVTVLCCVSTQFIMMLAETALDEFDLSSLRVVFTGGEAVPEAKAREFEERTGARILQFYGSNETGLLSGTTTADPLRKRLRTAGRIVPEMNVRLYDGPTEVTSSGRGQPACRGPALSLGYLGDEEANASLFTPDGWMLMGDICEVDEDGYLSVVGRISEFVVRGGKNIPLAVVENDALGHPAIRHAAAVPMPDPVLGERVCLFAELHPGHELRLDDLVDHLARQGVSRELFPERLEVVPELPRSSGAKVAKGELRRRIVQIREREPAPR
ncbi:acyl--CoA ligase [Nocardioides carbamazepini]|uniref:class I adenylate-forming enzyme family protein n=1 Tax=Nocardioides carbamazepini TaxID=2854259 RepID=UPI002149EB14|nr:class I adenylate-forming enzyme family protein [Nocardioides carbamazepini]MCR1784328.1 acyl--CoA ligase [Nocardioides carbamazepini]